MAELCHEFTILMFVNPILYTFFPLEHINISKIAKKKTYHI